MTELRRRTSDQTVLGALLASGHKIWGGILTLSLVGLIALLVYARGDYLQPAEWVALYAGIALVAGMVFWIVTPGGSGEIAIRHLGAKLGGGAAVGIVFMLIAKQITPSAESRLTLVTLPQRVSADAEIVALTPGLQLHRVAHTQLLAVFDERRRAGSFRLAFPNERTLTLDTACYSVQRDNEEPQPIPCR